MAKLNTGGDSGPPYYVSSNEPTDTEIGARWFDDGAGVFSLADGSRYSPVTPAYATDEAETFTESDVTITHNKTEVSNGHIELGNKPTGNLTTRPADNNTSTPTEYWGFVINPNKALEGLEFEKSANVSGADHVKLMDINENLLDTTTLTSGRGQVYADMSSGTEYILLLGNNGSSYTAGREDTGGYPYTGTDLDLTSGYIDDGTGSKYSSSEFNFQNIEGIVATTSGDATIDWAGPSDIASWDLATFQRTVDGETVTIDVVDSAGTVLFSDIPQNFDISTVAVSTDVRLVVNLSRASTANNPSLDYAARRWMR